MDIEEQATMIDDDWEFIDEDPKPVSFSMTEGGWYATIGILDHPRNSACSVGFLVRDPDGFKAEIGGTIARNLVSGHDLQAWLKTECRRLLPIIRDGDTSTLLVILDPSGSPVGTASWREDRWHELDAFRPVVPEEMIRRSEDLASSPALVDRMAHRYMKRPGGRTGVRGALNGIDGFFSNAVFGIPETRSTTMEFLRLRPWIVGAVGSQEFFRLVVQADNPEDILEPAGLAKLSPGFKRSWTAAAIACVDRFQPSDIETLDRNVELDTLELLCALPSEWLPKTKEEFEVAAVFSRIVNQRWVMNKDDYRELPRNGDPAGWTFPRQDIRTLMDGVKGRWTPFLKSVESETAPWPVDAHLRAIGDMVDQIAYDIVAPATYGVHGGGKGHARLTRVARRLLSPDGGIALLVDKSKKWHRGWWKLPILERFVSPGWQKLAAEFEHGGLHMRFLDTPTLLKAEGEAMDHCVHSLVHSCHGRHTHVASIFRRTTDGDVRSSTVQLRCRRNEVDILQHHSASNAEAPDADKKLLAEWIELVRTGTIVPKSIQPNIRSSRAPEFGIPAEGTPADWRGILRKELTKMGWDELVEEIRREDLESMKRIWSFKEVVS